jgi:hypothetical protein
LTVSAASTATSATSATSATTAANLSGTPALPNGTTATTQSQADGSTKLATTAYVDTGLAARQANLSLLAGTYTDGKMCTYTSSGTLLNCNTTIPTTFPGFGTTGSTAAVGNDSRITGAQPSLTLLKGTYVDGDICTYAASGTLLNCNTAAGGSQVAANLASSGATGVSGILPIANGGVNASSAAAGRVPNSTSTTAAGWTATPTLGIVGTTGGSLTLAGAASGSATINTSPTGLLGLPSATTFAGAPVLTGLTGYVYANGASQVGAASTIPLGSIVSTAGTLAPLYLANNTSGLLTLQPADGAITSYTLKLPSAQPSSGNTSMSCTAANPAVCTWVAPSGSNGLSGMTSGQLPVAASASTVTSSLAYATAATASTIVERDSSNNINATTFTGALSGNATSATSATTAGITYGTLTLSGIVTATGSVATKMSCEPQTANEIMYYTTSAGSRSQWYVG